MARRRSSSSASPQAFRRRAAGNSAPNTLRPKALLQELRRRSDQCPQCSRPVPTPSPPPPERRAIFFALLKPRVMSLVVLTAPTGMITAPGSVHPVLGFAALLAIAVGAGASGRSQHVVRRGYRRADEPHRQAAADPAGARAGLEARSPSASRSRLAPC